MRRYFYLEGAHQCLVHRHHTAGVIELSTVVGGREQGHQLPLGEKLVTVFDNLEGLCCVIILLVSMFPPGVIGLCRSLINKV